MATMTKQQLEALPPEYMAEDNNSQKLVHTSIAFIVLTTIVFTAFIISRSLRGCANGWEVWILQPFSYLCILGLCILGLLLVYAGGAGRHIAYYLLNDPDTVVTYLQIQTASEPVYMAAVTAPKIALLLVYLKIFVDQKIRILTWIVLGVVFIHFWASGVALAFAICQPFAYKWDKTIDGHCGDIMAGYRYVSIPNVITDLAILLMPLPTLWGLQMSPSKKIGVIATFLAGGLGIITAIIRLVGFYTTDLLSDPTFLSINTMTLTVVEAGAYFICACLPGIRPLAIRLYQRSGFASLVTDTFQSNKNSKSSQHDSRSLPLGDMEGNHRATISTARRFQGDDSSDRVHFIQLEQSYEVENVSMTSAEDVSRSKM